MSLSDRTMNTLVRMAMEAESFSNDVSGVSDVRVHAGAARENARARQRWMIGSSLALAAGLALTVAGVLVLTPTATNTGPQVTRSTPIDRAMPKPALTQPSVVTNPEKLLASATPAQTPNVRVTNVGTGPDQNMLVVITHSPETGLHCVRWGQAEGWNPKCLPEVSEAQIRSVRLTGTCSEDRPQITRIALSGPSGSLPISDAKAAQLADCIMRSDRPCDGSGACYLSAASKCLPANVSVRIESAGEER